MEARCLVGRIWPSFVLLLLLPTAHGWGKEGHFIVCSIAQDLLTETASASVRDLLPDFDQTLANWCYWADEQKFRYKWSSALHYTNTPDNLCNFRYTRDCKDGNGAKDRCVVGAVNNYTTQLLGSSSPSSYNLTQALLFLSHFMGDIHQPLHAGFASDRGGNTINVTWYRRKEELHHVWDSDIITTQEKKFYDGNLADLIADLQTNITSEWEDLVGEWETCKGSAVPCPNRYASESVTAACDWAYKDVEQGSVLNDPYFLTRVPIVNLRLAQAGVRLAATLNRIFGEEWSIMDLIKQKYD